MFCLIETGIIYALKLKGPTSGAPTLSFNVCLHFEKSLTSVARLISLPINILLAKPTNEISSLLRVAFLVRDRLQKE